MKSGKMRRSRDAMMQNKMAESYRKKGQFHKAEEHYRLAIEFDDEVPEFHTSLAWCIATNPRNRSPKLLQRGKEILGETIQRFHHADAAYHLALLCARENDLHTAVQLFDKALSLDPDHAHSGRERKSVIHRLKVEQEALEAKNNPKKSFLSKLFNKKK
jgi:tetratricopeptide (TPR) repeat protein